jgi:hypothetical protein
MCRIARRKVKKARDQDYDDDTEQMEYKVTQASKTSTRTIKAQKCFTGP